MTSQKTRLYAGAAAAMAIAAGLGFGLARMTAPKPPAPAEASKSPAKSTLELDGPTIKTAGIEIVPVSFGNLDSEILSQATVGASPEGQAVLTARANGAVTRIFKRLGDPVRAGEIVALVESREAAQIAADRSVANAKAALARQVLGREKRLYEQRVSPRQDFETAQAEATAADAEARRAASAAGAARVTRDGRSVAVASPISGRVTASTASLGAYVQPE